MGDTSADIEILLVHPPQQQLPVIFRYIVGRLDASGIAYAVVGRIALTRHEQARSVSDIEIVAELSGESSRSVTNLLEAARQQFGSFMDRTEYMNAISVSIAPCEHEVDRQFLIEADVCDWFGVAARMASAEHLLWHWCRSQKLDNFIDAIALVKGAHVNLQRVRWLLHAEGDRDGRSRLCQAIGEAVLEGESSYSHYMEERLRYPKPGVVPVWRLPKEQGD